MLRIRSWSAHSLLPAPRRTEGCDAIRKHFADFAAAPLKLQVRNMVVHATADPEVVIAEWDYDGVVTTTGRSFSVSNVQVRRGMSPLAGPLALVSRVRYGKIVESRDYHNHAFLAAVMDRLSTLVAGCTEKQT